MIFHKQINTLSAHQTERNLSIMIKVYFPNLELSMELPDNATVADACASVGHPVNLVCGGNGTCGKCIATIEDAKGYREVHACQTPISSDMKIYPPENKDDLRILSSGSGKVKLDHREHPEEHRYAAACDLGTTSVVLYLFDRVKGKLLGQWSEANRQASLGADVIARMQNALEEGTGPRLQEKGLETIRALLKAAASGSGIHTTDIAALTVAGNSAMQHLLFGFPVVQLAKSPYQCYDESVIVRTTEDLDLGMAPGAKLYFLPLIGSFVGGDTTAAMLAADWEDMEPVKLLIDLGTNGELVIGNKDRQLATSAAAGPAMEGAGIVRGMRGTTGAIEKVWIEDGDIAIHVIGAGHGAKPEGICGSGLVDLTAVLVEAGVIDSSGRMSTKEDYLAQGGNPKLAERIRTAEDGQRIFLVVSAADTADCKDLFFYQDDIRALQLSKGAITAAAIMLQNEFDPDRNQITEILLAGAFGNYIDINSAQRIGLIPDYEGISVTPVGNAAGIGAQMYLLSESKRKAADRLAADTKHVDLASHEDFTYIFAACMELCPVSEMDLEDFF